MRVALVSDWYHPRVGGIELHLQDLAAHLRAAGHQVVVITPTPGPAEVNGVPVYRVKAPLAPRFGFLTTRGGIDALGRAIDAAGVDVAHCHVSIVSPAGFGGALEAERRGMPAVVTFHSIIPNTHLFARAVNALFGTSQWRVRYSAVSQRVADEIRAVAGRSAVTLLPNGIDVDFWRAVPARPRGRAVQIVSVMRLNPKKRPLALVALMRRIASQLPADQQITLRIVGDGPERARLERSIARHRLADRIELLGWQSREQIRSLLADSDIFVLPTVRESFGLAALEARCAGLPVVAMRASGVAGLIEHGVEGLLASSDEELADLTASLVRDADQRTDIASHNRSTTPPFDWPSVIDAHVALYREAIALRETV